MLSFSSDQYAVVPSHVVASDFCDKTMAAAMMEQSVAADRLVHRLADWFKTATLPLEYNQENVMFHLFLYFVFFANGRAFIQAVQLGLKKQVVGSAGVNFP